MARIVQYQRRALEHVISKPVVNFFLEAGQTYFLNNGIAFLAGVSDGEGTCSDMHNVYIAVLTRNPKDSGRIRFLDSRKLACSGAVLLRNREGYESESEIHPDLLATCLAVEGLKMLHQDDNLKRVFFRQNGNTKLYVPMA